VFTRSNSRPVAPTVALHEAVPITLSHVRGHSCCKRLKCVLTRATLCRSRASRGFLGDSGASCNL